SVVVLPAPFPPIRVTISPSSTPSVTPLSASILPYRTWTSCSSSSTGRPQVGLDHPGVVPDVVRSPLGDLLAEVEDGQLVAHPRRAPPAGGGAARGERRGRWSGAGRPLRRGRSPGRSRWGTAGCSGTCGRRRPR